MGSTEFEKATDKLVGSLQLDLIKSKARVAALEAEIKRLEDVIVDEETPDELGVPCRFCRRTLDHAPDCLYAEIRARREGPAIEDVSGCIPGDSEIFDE